jgi:hypothetical protein
VRNLLYANELRTFNCPDQERWANSVRHGLKAAVLEYTAGDGDIGESCTWVLCSRDGAGEGGGGREVLWTDDRTDLLSVLKWR